MSRRIAYADGCMRMHQLRNAARMSATRRARSDPTVAQDQDEERAHWRRGSGLFLT